MDALQIKYRNWYNGQPPKPIKLEIPGWAGQPNKHTDGDAAQPWHCVPFVEASTYGLELTYAFDTECHVCNVDGQIEFLGDFTEENKRTDPIRLPPFMTFAPGHFGMTSCLDVQVPPGYVLRLEPHPRFYTDDTNTVPCCIAGHIQTEWWPKYFFVVFKNPAPGQRVIFRKGEAYGQILVVPQKVEYQIQSMTTEEADARCNLTESIEKNAKLITKNSWKDHNGLSFDDLYKQLAKAAKTGSVQEFVDQKVASRIKYKGKFVKRKQ